jgi:hypothetical protein
MDKIALASLNSFGPSPEADAPPDDPILEIPASELQGLLKDLVTTYNQIAEVIRDSGILRGRELARLTEDHNQVLRAERAPITKLLMLNAFIRQHLTRIREAMKSRPAEGGKVIQVVSKIAARAIQIVEYVKTIAQDSPRKEIALDSGQARILFSGAGGEPVSRKETIRAMRRAEALWPALQCSHRPNDGRQTTRITGIVEELKDAPEFGYRGLWQRSGKSIGLCI